MTTFNVNKSFSGFTRDQVEAEFQSAGVQHRAEWQLGDGYSGTWPTSRATAALTFCNRGAVDQGRLFAALDSVPSGGWVNGLPVGTPVCRAAQTNPAYAGCVAARCLWCERREQ